MALGFVQARRAVPQSALARLWSSISAWFVRSQPARPSLTLTRRAYDGASTGRLYANWIGASTGVNSEIQQGIETLRSRSRESVRNNPIAARAIEALTANVVGTGIRPRLVTDDEALRGRVHGLWDRWSAACSVSDDLTVYGLQAMAVRAMFESGEVFLRRRWRRPEDRLPVPLQVQVLEADYCPIYQTQLQPQAGGQIVQGVEFDAIDRRVAYWLLRRHPGEWLGVLDGSALEPSRIPAGEVSHLFEPLRPGQVRGAPKMSPVLTALRDLADYDLCERQRKKSEAGITGFVLPGDNTDFGEESIASPEVTDQDGNLVDDIEPGMLAVLRNGKDIRFTQPAQNAGYSEYIRAQVRLIAAGLSMPYELFGDLSQVNYSSYRAGWVEFRRYVTTVQQNVVIPLLCEKMWGWFIEAAIVAGELPAGEYRAKWIPPRFEDVDKLKEVQAAVAEMRAGLRSWRDSVRERGEDPDETLAEIVADFDRLRAVGLWLDSDPNKGNGQGAPSASSADNENSA
jgi:lambda family phage portal protein